jgi:hypothetical protein
MTRRFLDDVRADLTALLVTAGATTALELQPLLIDTIDSSVDDECVVGSTIPAVGIPILVTWTPIVLDGVGGAVYDTAVGGDATFLKVSIPLGKVTLSTVPGFTYEVEGYINFSDLGSNVAIDFSILVDGVPVGFLASLTGGGSARARSATMKALILSTGADAVIELGVRTPDGAQAIDTSSLGILVTIKPTNNP